MKLKICWLAILSALLLYNCAPSRSRFQKDDGRIELVFVQVNDVYEIAPLEGGKTGGMARVATIKKTYKAANANTFMVMAGDFLSPSVYNSLQYQGKRIRGKQMVETMNAAGVDFAVFGNHEFDINQSELQERINESAFQWISSNSFQVTNGNINAFKKKIGNDSADIPAYYILSVADADGTMARVGIIGITIPSNQAPFVSYTEPLSTAKSIYNRIKDSCDAVIAITHQGVGEDRQLAAEIPGLAAILGGHEHNMQLHKVGNMYISKAHSNGRSAFIVRLIIDRKRKQVQPEPELKYITDAVIADVVTDSVVKKWMRIAEANYASVGFSPEKIAIPGGEPLDGRETATRNHATNLTQLIVQSMAFACPEADVVLFNSGSIRVDDILQPPVTEYDILRTLPYGGGIREVDMKGSLLKRVLDVGVANRNSGGYLQSGPVVYDSSKQVWALKGQPLSAEKVYRVALTDYLIAGLEKDLGFLQTNNPDISKVYEQETSVSSAKSDIRLAVIRYLASTRTE